MKIPTRNYHDCIVLAFAVTYIICVCLEPDAWRCQPKTHTLECVLVQVGFRN